jgi:hypothetical protein
MRNTVIVGWVAAITAMVTMVIGHLGGHELNWKANQISTYAAAAPFDYLITTSMVLSATALLTIGILVSKYQILGSGFWPHFIPPLVGAAASGLAMLAYYEETARTLTILSRSDFWAIREQSFHDAALQIFFFSSVILVVISGVLLVLSKSAMPEKLLGLCILALGSGSFLLMRTSWPEAIGMAGATVGFQQKTSLLCLWLASICVLTIASRRLRTATNGG